MLVESDLTSILFGCLVSVGGASLYFLEKKRRFKRFIDLTLEGIVLSKDNRIVEMNAQALKSFGNVSKNDFLGKNILDFVAPESKVMVEQQFAGDSDLYECVFVRKDGTHFPALVKGSNIGLRKTLRLSAIVDLSELKHTQYKLQALNETLEMQVCEQIEKNRQQELMLFHQARHAQMGEMISMIAHQWRQPLNVLSLLSQNIVLKYNLKKLDDDTMSEFKEISLRQILQMSKTIDDFRDFFKPDKVKKKFDVKKQLDYIIELMRPIVGSYEIEIVCQSEEGLIVESFPNEFSQSIINILHNAKDVLAECDDSKAKMIVINAFRSEDGMIVIAIEDNGKGVDERIIARIFEPYFSTKESQHGTGLGLYMTKMIIEDHMQGCISVENTHEGARFEIKLKAL